MPLYNQYVNLVTAQTVGGAKTFTSAPIMSGSDIDITHTINGSFTATGTILSDAAAITTSAIVVSAGAVDTGVKPDTGWAVGSRILITINSGVNHKIWPDSGANSLLMDGSNLGAGNNGVLVSGKSYLLWKNASSQWVVITLN